MFKWLTLTAGILYIVLGIIIIFQRTFINALDPTTAYILGGLFIAYGIFRVFRGISYLKSRNDE